MAHSILRLPAVQKRTGLSRSSIYRRINEGTFPRQVKLGGGSKGRAIGFLDSEISDWLSLQIKERRDITILPSDEPE